ncbi:hypothetical protein ACFQ60_45530 [Streptomyces zhihengii]
MAGHTLSYQYEFADRGAMDHLGLPVSFPLGAPHGSEIRYVFGGVSGTPPRTPWRPGCSATGPPSPAPASRTRPTPPLEPVSEGAGARARGDHLLDDLPQDHRCDLWLPGETAAARR